jgi:hypothetical protein
MDLKVLVTDLLWCAFLLKCLHFSGCTVLISAADVESIVPSKTAIPGENISTQHATNNVAQVRYIVDVGQRTRDQHIAFIVYW